MGRLDYDSEGLVLMTNDGELAYRLMHPRFHVPKAYRVWVSGRPNDEAIARLRSGVMIEGRTTAPARRVHLKGGNALRSKLSFIINEGRKREIRLMCAIVGHPVQRLVRVGLGPLHLGDLPQGVCRRLSQSEVIELKAAAGLITGCKPSLHGVKKSSQAAGGGDCTVKTPSRRSSSRNKGR
ncbi:Pseudouridine synthase (modular protein) [Desulfarculales bacterium]